MVSPTVFGPIKWNDFHLTIENYPNNPSEEDKNFYYDLLTYYIPKSLPCNACSISSLLDEEENPMVYDDLKDRSTLRIWGINKHNRINKKLGKKELSIKEATNEIYKLKLGIKKVENDFIVGQYGNLLIENTELKRKVVYQNKQITEMKQIILFLIFCIAAIIIILLVIKFYYLVK